MTWLYIKAAMVVAVSLLACILVTKAAWPSNVLLFKLFAAWCKTLPEKWKRFRDPAYRRRMETIENYLAVFGALIQLRAGRDAFRLRRQDAASEAAARLLDAMIEDVDMRFQGMQTIAVEIMRGMDAAGVEAVAEHLSADLFAGNVPPADLRAFLEEERTLIVASPHFAAGHATRLAKRFGDRTPSARPPS